MLSKKNAGSIRHMGVNRGKPVRGRNSNEKDLFMYSMPIMDINALS